MHCKASRSFIHTVELKHAIADNNLSLPFEFWSDDNDFNNVDSGYDFRSSGTYTPSHPPPAGYYQQK